MGTAERLAGVERGRALTFTVNGAAVTAFEGESIAAALLAAGRPVLRRSQRSKSPRGVFCGMGVCFECVVTVDGRPNVRACMMAVAEGMTVATTGT